MSRGSSASLQEVFRFADRGEVEAREALFAILFGSASGLDGARDLFWYDENVGGTREAVDWFGEVLVAGDFDGDGHDDLAIGAPFENPGGLGDAGAQTILYGSLFADGFETRDTAIWSVVAP